MVETHLGVEGLLAVLLWLLAIVRGDRGGLLVETGLLLLLGLWPVLVEESEELGRGVLVEGVAELGDRGRDLEALVEDDLLSLQTHVFGPLDEAGQVTGGLDVLAWWCFVTAIRGGGRLVGWLVVCRFPRKGPPRTRRSQRSRRLMEREVWCKHDIDQQVFGRHFDDALLQLHYSMPPLALVGHPAPPTHRYQSSLASSPREGWRSSWWSSCPERGQPRASCRSS